MPETPLLRCQASLVEPEAGPRPGVAGPRTRSCTPAIATRARQGRCRESLPIPSSRSLPSFRWPFCPTLANTGVPSQLPRPTPSPLSALMTP
eukprot:3852426-Pyramimonas_sp.AAC.1